jgi:ribosomal protein S18 acetylase RimI-like enzyme
MEELLATLSPSDRADLTTCVRKIQGILSAKERPSSAVRIVRATASQAVHARQLLNEYYRELTIVQKDTEDAIQDFLSRSDSALWIAYVNTVPAGCVALRPLSKPRSAAECKRLYVRARFRGQGIADALMDALEESAMKNGLSWIYLDTKDDLNAAITLYRRRGYMDCKRYNDNPQATIFLRKALTRKK